MTQNITLVPLSQLSDRQIDSICEIHKQTIPSLLSQFGLPFLKKYYQLAAKSPDVISICALDPSGRVLGWAVGSVDPGGLYSQLRSDGWWFFKKLFAAFVRQPNLIIDVALQVIPNSVNLLSERQVELTYIAVDADSRSSGIGERLLAAFLDHARVYGVQSCYLSVEVENTIAARFYQKHGFSILATFKEGRYQRHRMFLLLDPQKALC